MSTKTNIEYTPLVSIVIPAYNASNYLAEAIESALAQTYEKIEIIVVNDGSPDDGATRKVALRYGDKIRYFEKTNGGSSSALNYGIREMRGEWFSWLSHDDLYYPQKVERQIDYIRSLRVEQTELCNQVLFSASELIDEVGKLISRPTKSEVNKIYDRVKKSDNSRLIAEPTENCFHGCSCLVHRSAFENVGFFDESLRLLNDIDMWYRLYSNKFCIHYVPEVLVKGRIHAKQISRSIEFSYHNPEQDMFWKRSLDWLETNYPDGYDLYYMFGRNAYRKTRYVDGKRAYMLAATVRPERKVWLFVAGYMYRIRGQIRSFAKNVYITLKKI